MTTAIEQTLETYGIENWGAGYFDVNRKGNLIVHPAENDSRAADLKEIIEDLARRGIGTPFSSFFHTRRSRCENSSALSAIHTRE